MAVVQTDTENQQKISLSRRITTYIASMNFAKVFRRHQPKESTPPLSKSSERPPFIHQHYRYNRPFSYHLPKTEQLSPASLTNTSNVVPYRIGLSGDSTLLTNAQTNENDDIVRLPIKSSKSHKDRRCQSQLNANKRWLYRSMETLDGWKDKVFSQKHRNTNSNQSRSRSVENLADADPTENVLMNHNPATITQQQRAVSPNRSIEAITNRVINSIGIHRKSTQSVLSITRSPALTIKKQLLLTHSNKGHSPLQKQNNTNHDITSSAILDFHEISSLGFSQSRSRFMDERENISLTPSEHRHNGVLSNDDDNEEVTSDLSFLGHGYDQNNDTGDSWDFSITWIDSLKEQQSPQRKIQFYENLIKLLEQDTLNIDELLVLRKVLAKIWPTDEITTAIDNNNDGMSLDSKTIGTKSLHAPNRIKRRSKLSTMTHHTAQRCSAIIEQSPLVYEPLHEQRSGHGTRPASLLLAAKAKPCLIKNNHESIPYPTENCIIEQTYPQHLNPFNDETDITASAPSKEHDPNNNDCIRRYFERLTLLETIYEKLNLESNKSPSESIDHHQTFSTPKNSSHEQQMETKQDSVAHPQTISSNKTDASKTISNKFFEMNVDGNGSMSSGRSSLKRRAPTAPHVSFNGNNHQKNPRMFTLSSADINVPHKSIEEVSIPIRHNSHEEKCFNGVSSKERLPLLKHNAAAASCDDDGLIFVDDVHANHNGHHINEEQPVVLPKRTERIHEWLSSCETKEDSDLPNKLSALPHQTSPTTQLKIRCTAKPMRNPSLSPAHYQEKNLLAPMNHEMEPGRYRTSLKIHLETNEPTHPRSRVSSATSRYYQRPILSPSYSRDHQAVYL